MDVIAKLHAYTSRKMFERVLARRGQTRTCPWCYQCVEDGHKDAMRVSEWCDLFDTHTCGHCGGESIWEFGPCPLIRGLGAPPPGAEWAHEAHRETDRILAAIRVPTKEKRDDE